MILVTPAIGKIQTIQYTLRTVAERNENFLYAANSTND
jgi:hypothetical protein